MKYEVLPLPAPTSPTDKEIHELKLVISDNRGKWVRIKLAEGDVLNVDDVRAWRFGRCGETAVEVRHDEGSLTPRWIDVRIPEKDDCERIRNQYHDDQEHDQFHEGQHDLGETP